MILWEDVESDALLWQIVRNADGSYRISPKKNLGLSLCVENPSSGNNAKVKLATTSASADNQKWIFELSTTGVGGAGAYRQVNSPEIRCYAYALELNDTPEFGEPGYLDFQINSDTVYTLGDKLCALKSIPGHRVRRLESATSPIHPTAEYRIAMRITTEYYQVESFGVIYDAKDYHFMVQLNTGGWAHKQGGTDSVALGNINPSTYSWGVPDDPDRYDSATLYFAVCRVAA